MDEAIDPPEPPTALPEHLTEAVEDLTPRELRSLVEFTRARLEHLEKPIPELIEVGEDEEIVSVDDYDVYTVVVKGQRCAEGCDECPHNPRAYVVTIEHDAEGERRLHWEDIGRTLG